MPSETVSEGFQGLFAVLSGHFQLLTILFPPKENLGGTDDAYEYVTQ